MKIDGRKVRGFTGGLVMAAFVSLLLGCGAEPPQSASNEPAPAAEVQAETGETLFKGVFFGVGSSGRRLDGIWKGKTFADYVVQLTDPTSLRSAADALQKLDGNQKIAADIERAAGSLSSESGPALAADIKDAIRLFDYDTIINRIGNRDPAFFGRFQTEIRSGNQLRVNAIYNEGRDKLVAAFEEGNSGEANALVPKWCEYCYVETIFFVFAVGAAFAVVVIAVPGLQGQGTDSQLQNQMNVDTITQQLAL